MQFAEVLQHHSVPYWTEGKYCRPGWVQFHCPFCAGGTDPEKPYAGYHTHTHKVNCWRCGPHGMGQTIVALTGITWREVKELLEDLELPIGKQERPVGKLTLPDGVGKLLKCHRIYLRERGFDPRELAKTWDVQGIGFAERLAYRLFIPIHYHGRVVSWTTRSLRETGMRYISAKLVEEAMPHKTILYGEDKATNAIVIHEGPTDVWRTGPGAVGTLGTGFTAAQIFRMSRYPLRIVCLDNEPAGQRRAEWLISQLSVFPGETLNVRLDAKDAGSASDKEIRRLRKLLR